MISSSIYLTLFNKKNEIIYPGVVPKIRYSLNRGMLTKIFPELQIYNNCHRIIQCFVSYRVFHR